MKRTLKGIKAFWIGFVMIPFISILILFEDIWDWTIGSRIRNKSKQR